MYLKSISLYAAANIVTVHVVVTATKCLLNFRHKSLLSFSETCATVISFCVSTREVRGARKVSRVLTDGRSQGGKGRGWQSPLTIARSTEECMLIEREEREARGRDKDHPGFEGSCEFLAKLLVTDTLHYARRQLGQSIPPGGLTPPSVYPFNYIQVIIANNYRKREEATSFFALLFRHWIFKNFSEKWLKYEDMRGLSIIHIHGYRFHSLKIF